MLNSIFSKVDKDIRLSRDEIIYLLNTENVELIQLYEKADTIRKLSVGDEIYLRGIIEISNYCKKNCCYCGIRKHNNNVKRYRMTEEDIIKTCHDVKSFGQTTVVLQSGEDDFFTKEYLGHIIKRIKNETRLAITISVGERDKDTYAFWKEMGMDRYLLRFETCNNDIFSNSHPDDVFDRRISCLKTLRSLGVQTGSGFLIGLPYETITDLANDIIFCTDLDLDMIGIGPFIPHTDTPFSSTSNPFDSEIFFKVISIIRLMNKFAHIPATTAFDTINKNGRNLLLERGANVFMPNATPSPYREHYLLYPGKPCVDESGNQCANCTRNRIKSLGRKFGTGPGHSLRKNH